MVRLQTLDLRIGVQVPASQPFILKHFRKSSKSRHASHADHNNCGQGLDAIAPRVRFRSSASAELETFLPACRLGRRGNLL